MPKSKKPKKIVAPSPAEIQSIRKFQADVMRSVDHAASRKPQGYRTKRDEGLKTFSVINTNLYDKSISPKSTAYNRPLNSVRGIETGGNVIYKNGPVSKSINFATHSGGIFKPQFKSKQTSVQQ